jgi:hypothetical protein
MLSIYENAKISRLVDIEDSSRGSTITVCDGVMIASVVKIKPAAGVGNIRIGRNSYSNSGVVMSRQWYYHRRTRFDCRQSHTRSNKLSVQRSQKVEIARQRFQPSRSES